MKLFGGTKMRTILMLGAVVLALAGCAGPISLGLLGKTSINSSPAANAMRTCAALSDVVTPGISPQAVTQLARGILEGPLALGNTPASALRNCAKIIDTIND